MTGFAGVWTPGANTAASLLSQMVDATLAPISPSLTLAAWGRARVVARADSGLVVVADARLDDPTGGIDAIDAMAADLERLGRDAPGRWLGDFACAFYDPARRELSLVRDPMGVKSLFLARLGNATVFATDLATLLACPGLSLEADERALVDYIGGFPEDPERTAFASVKRVPPATIVTLSERGSSSTTYWDPGRVRELSWRDDDAYAAALRDTLHTAVRRRVPKGGRCAVLMSGGLDSSSIAALAVRELGRDAVTTFGAIFDDSPDADERRHQQAVARHTGAEHVAVALDHVDAGLDLNAALDVFREPGPVGDHWLAWPLLADARRRGIDVALTGIDGDRIVWHGGGRLEELAAAGAIGTLFHELAARHGTRKALTLTPRWLAHVHLPSELRKRLQRERIPGGDLYAAAFRVLRVDVLARHGVRERLEDVWRQPANAREAHVAALRRADRTADLDLCSALGPALGVEIRHPFFDREVVELCLALPGDQKLRNGVTRFVLRQAMREVLPESVRHRPDKTSLDSAFEVWALRANNSNIYDFEQLRDLIQPDVLMTREGGLPVDLVWRCVVGSAWLDRKRIWSRGATRATLRATKDSEATADGSEDRTGIA